MIKKKNIIIIIGLLIITIFISGYVGYVIAENKNVASSEYEENRMINFSVIILEDLKDGYDEDLMENLISKIFAAHEYSNDDISPALYDLWDALISDGGNIVGKEDALIEALQSGNPQEIQNIAKKIRLN